MSPPSKPPRRQRSFIGGFMLGLVRWGFALAILAILGVAVAVALTTASLPGFSELKKSPQGQSVVVRAADGTELVTIGPSYGRWLPYHEIPPQMVEAMKAVEDRRFDWHPGVDPIGIARSAQVNFNAGRTVQGASTITQQLARNLFLTSTQTYVRKGREALLALAMERKFSKEQIMELYLNRVYFGGGAYGIDAASRRFYGHPATELDLEKSAIIAGLVKAPSRYSPTADPEKARGRAKIVVITMQQSGAISPAEAAAADIDGVRFAVDQDQGGARYYTDWVLTQLETLTDEAVEPLEVMTTLQPAQQAAAEAAIASQPLGSTQAAIVGMRTDGAVTALVGGRDYARSNYNRAVTARRQPGSSWKLFPYLVALEEGMTPMDRVVDEPIRINGWSPRNSNGRFLGAMTLRQAFALSVNTVAVQLGARFGFDAVESMARRFGITTRIDTRPAMALGASDVTLLELTSAYASVAAGGVEARPWAIQSITTSTGQVLYNREAETPRVLVAPFVAAYMTDMLRAAVETGTGRAAKIGRPLAGKTGTTSSNKDGWFIGFTPELVAGVWMGRDDARAVPGLAGGQAPARLFQAFMARAVSGTVSTDLADDVAVPDIGMEPDAEVYGISPEGQVAPDAPVEPAPPAVPDAPAPLTDRWLEDVMKEEQAKQ